MKNFLIRSVSAILLLPVFIIALFSEPIIAIPFFAILSALILAEWFLLTNTTHKRNKYFFYAFALLQFVFLIFLPIYSLLAIPLMLLFYGIWQKEKSLLFYFGVLYLVLFFISILCMHQFSAVLLLIAFGIVWATDIGAYIFGRLIGGPKIAPKMSPSKTWAGLTGGVICAGSLNLFAFYQFSKIEFFAKSLNYLDWVYLFFVGAIFAILAQIGDFFESYLKRSAGVKDSGSLIPGHGGFLDRFDGALIVLPFFLIWYVLWTSWG